LGSDDFAPAAKADAAGRLTAALVDGSLRVPVTERLPLEEVAEAHELVERGHTGRVILQLS
jgi:NADPH2:quinone reductase